MKKSLAYIVAAVIAGAVFGAGGMYQYLLPSDPVQVDRLKTPGVASMTPIVDDTILYENSKYLFSLAYPVGLVVKEFDEGNDSMTVVFQKPGERVGFQVYITPHGSDTISGEIIRRDVPSGKIEDLKEERIRPDILAATFWSEAPLTGRNREIWFLHGGYLYEFTAYDAADALLREVLTTLKLGTK